MDNDRIKDIVLSDIENIMMENGRSLKDFPPMPLPSSTNFANTANLLLIEETNYNKEELKIKLNQDIPALTDEQRNVFHNIMDACTNDKGGCFFVNGFGGTGKTFIWNTLTTSLQARGDIVLEGII